MSTLEVPENLRRYHIACPAWRKWLLARSLRWSVSGFKRSASIAWRLARVFANENTEMACAAYCGQLLMMGDDAA